MRKPWGPWVQPWVPWVYPWIPWVHPWIPWVHRWCCMGPPIDISKDFMGVPMGSMGVTLNHLFSIGFCQNNVFLRAQLSQYACPALVTVPWLLCAPLLRQSMSIIRAPRSCHHSSRASVRTHQHEHMQLEYVCNDVCVCARIDASTRYIHAARCLLVCMR